MYDYQRLGLIVAVIGGLYYWSKKRNNDLTNNAPTSAFSIHGIDMLEALEGFKSHPYRDQAGYWTIGYGTRITDTQAQQYKDGVSKSVAETWLLNHVNQDAQTLNLASLNLPQNIYDAVLITTYNIGATAMKRSKAFAAIKNHNWGGAVNEWDWYYYTDPTTGEKLVSQGLKNRRSREINLIMTGQYYYG